MEKQVNKVLRIKPEDNVGVALTEISKGMTVELDGLMIKLVDNIPVGHKFALRDLTAGEEIIKYGYSIGRAKVPIKTGQ